MACYLSAQETPCGDTVGEKAAACKSGRETTPETADAGALISDFRNSEKSISGVYGVACHPVVFRTAASVDQVKVKSITQLCLTFRNLRDCSPPGSSVHGIFQTRRLEWVAISFSGGIFPIQGSNLGLPNCRQILYRLSQQGSPLTKT